MENYDHPALIDERKQNINAAAYKKHLNKEINLPSKKKEIDRNDKTEY